MEGTLEEKAENTEIKAIWTYRGTEGEEGLADSLTIISFRERHGSQATSYRPSLTILLDTASHLG